MSNIVILKDALYNVCANSGASIDYGKGVVVGAVSAIMASGSNFKDAIAKIAIAWPNERHNARLDCIPEPWRNDFTAARVACLPTRIKEDGTPQR